MDLYLLLPLLSCLMSAASAIVVWLRDPRHPGNRVASLMMAATSYWALCQVMWTHAGDAESALWIHRAAGPGWAFIGPLVLHVMLYVTRSEGGSVRRALPALYGVGAVFALLQLTPWMHARAVPEPWGWGFETGPVFGVFLVFTLALVIPAIVMGFLGVRNAPSPAIRRQVRLVSLGIAVPLLIAPMTGGLLPMLGIQMPRLGATSFAILAVTIAYSNHRYGFSALVPGTFSREILETLPDGVALIEPDGSVRFANEGLAGLLGLPLAEMAGVCLPGRLGIESLWLREQVREVECALDAEDGEIPVAVSTSPLRDKRGIAIGTVVVVRDLREVVGLRDHLVTSGRLAAVGQLAAGIAHEINNPIAYVRANLAQLALAWHDLAGRVPAPADDPELDRLRTEGAELIAECVEGVDRTAEIVQDVKGFAHGGSGGMHPVEINRVVEAALRVAGPNLVYHVTVDCDLGDVPPVTGAGQELEQVIVNLLVNAGQAVGERGRIRVATRRDVGHVVIEVSDDGCGIAESDVTRIFDPFFTTKPVGEGTGLGLAISYQIVRKHGGEMSVESRPGEGTSFFVRLPIEPLPSLVERPAA